MSKCCENCEHRTVCEIYHNPKFKMTKCTEWSGWHDVKEDPPKVGMKIVAENRSIVFSGKVIEDHGLTINAGFVRMKLLNFEKWHDLPEDEVKE